MFLINHRQASKGFTIVELLVVVAIISVLVALLVPSLGKVRDQGRRVKGLSNLRQIGQGILGYSLENNNSLPIGFENGVTDWTILVNSQMTGRGDTLATFGEMNEVFHDPNAASPQGNAHYSAHPFMMPNISEAPGAEGPFGAFKLVWLRDPSDVILVMDGVQDPTSGQPYSASATTFKMDNYSAKAWPYSSADDEDPVDETTSNDNTDSAANTGNIRFRQITGLAANMLFPDGHAETVRKADLRKHHTRPLPPK